MYLLLIWHMLNIWVTEVYIHWLVDNGVQVNEREGIVIGSWVAKVQYNAFCHALGTGMSIHLQVRWPGALSQ